jgi:1-acylglycerone phosphate reductase
VRATFETNVFGVMAMVQAFAPLLISAKGLIINIASLSAITPYVFGSVYCSTKGAVVSYSRCLRQELRPFGVRVMVAMTGTVRSNTASHGHRQLPPDSLYQRVRHIFEWRLTYSQNHATVPTEIYAKQLVNNALKPETPVWLRLWFGRADWFWAGGMAGITWIGTWFGEWMTDVSCYAKFRLPELDAILRKEAAQKKLR